MMLGLTASIHRRRLAASAPAAPTGPTLSHVWEMNELIGNEPDTGTVGGLALSQNGVIVGNGSNRGPFSISNYFSVGDHANLRSTNFFIVWYFNMLLLDEDNERQSFFDRTDLRTWFRLVGAEYKVQLIIPLVLSLPGALVPGNNMAIIGYDSAVPQFYGYLNQSARGSANGAWSPGINTMTFGFNLTRPFTTGTFGRIAVGNEVLTDADAAILWAARPWA